MRSIRRNYFAILKQYPDLSAAGAFRLAIIGKKMTRRSIATWFEDLVPKGDYGVADRNEIVEGLWKASNPSKSA